MTADELWDRMLRASGLHRGTIRRYLSSPEVVHEVAIIDETFVIVVSSPYFKRWIESRLIRDWSSVCPLEIRVVVEEREREPTGVSEESGLVSEAAGPWWVNQ